MSFRFEELINKIDWDKYKGPEYYRPNELINALRLINSYNPKKDKDHIICNNIYYGLGNNHRGTYYPAVLDALDIIIHIEQHSPSKNARVCAYWTLHDLYYFHPELGEYSGHTEQYIENFVKSKLEPYAEELKINKKWWQFWK